MGLIEDLSELGNILGEIVSIYSECVIDSDSAVIIEDTREDESQYK
jgi:hypothetical protein